MTQADQTNQTVAAAHTPGPWTQCDEIVVVTPETHGYGTWLANCAVGGNSRAEQRANARLIAAAPAMAKALELIIQWNRDHARDQYGDPDKAESWACIVAARAALALAATA